MPVYEYRCFNCDGQFEKLEPMAARENGVDCPACGERGAKRLLSTFAAFASVSDGPTRALGGCCGGASGACGCHP